MFAAKTVVGILALFSIHFALATERTGLVESPTARNLSLLVGVSHGLPGIGKDIKNMTDIGSHPSYEYQETILEEGAGTSGNVVAALTELSGSIEGDGSLLFYFSGHGATGIIRTQNGSLSIQSIRKALQTGRENKTPLKRLIMAFDSCQSGSLVDPVLSLLPSKFMIDDTTRSVLFANAIADEMTAFDYVNGRSADQYWEKLFVFASSRANESSVATSSGSLFTIALRKAFNESIQNNMTINQFIQKTQTYTTSHHPVARLVPTTLGEETMH